MPVVSVILPTYNAEKFLKESIDSILNQTFNDFELLIIDDNSQDKTRKIVKSYQDKRIKLLNGPGKGLAAALNLGINEAAGKYIARMDADDISLPERFAEQVAYLDEHPDVSILGTWQEHFNERGSQGVHMAALTDEEIRVALIFNCDMCHSTLMFRKDAFIQNHINYPENSPQEDYELWLSCIKILKFANIPQVLGRHRNSEFSITKAKREILKNYQIELVGKYLQNNLGLKLSSKEKEIFQRFDNPIEGKNKSEIKKYIQHLNRLFNKIEKRNQIVKAFNSKLLRTHIIKNYNYYSRGYGYKYSSEYIEAPKVKYKVFDKFTILKIIKYYNHSKFYLFGWLPLLKLKNKTAVTKVYLFNIIPLFSIVENIIPNYRIDLYNGGTPENDIIIQNKDLRISQPEWFKKPSWKKLIGNGRVVIGLLSYFWQKKIIFFKAKGSGSVDIELKSPDIKLGNKKVAYLVDYKKLRLNNKSVFKKTQKSWHDKPLCYSFPVEDQNIYQVSFYVRKHIPSITEIISKLKK